MPVKTYFLIYFCLNCCRFNLKGPDEVKMGALDKLAYSDAVFGFIARKGCDGKSGSMLQLDRCGICDGNEECVGCDNTPFSGRVLNFH